MEDNAFASLIYLALPLVMGYRGAIKPLPNNYSRSDRIIKVLEYGFYGWLMSMGLFLLFGFWDAMGV